MCVCSYGACVSVALYVGVSVLFCDACIYLPVCCFVCLGLCGGMSLGVVSVSF